MFTCNMSGKWSVSGCSERTDMSRNTSAEFLCCFPYVHLGAGTYGCVHHIVTLTVDEFFNFEGHVGSRMLKSMCAVNILAKIAVTAGKTARCNGFASSSFCCLVVAMYELIF